MKLHIICERDAGLFSLIQQVISNIPWAMREGRIPVVYFKDKTCYWTPKGFRGKDTVWEYYFKPVLSDYPASIIPAGIREVVALNHPSPVEVGYFADDHTFVSNHFGDHPALEGKALPIPYLWDDPDIKLRQEAHEIIRCLVTPRQYLRQKVKYFYQQYMRGHRVIGVHARGTDAISKEEIRPHRQGSLDLSEYVTEIERLLTTQVATRIFVATDDQSSLDYLKSMFGQRVFAYDSIRHQSGAAAGKGPTGWIMPAYIANDRDRAARNGEEAVIEYLLLSQCNYLVHNGSGLARTVLLNVPLLPHRNLHLKKIEHSENPMAHFV
jgi:hypothetical protein